MNDLDRLRARLAGSTGRRYWQSLEELAGTPAFEELLAREFPREAAVWKDTPDRRDALKVMGAALVLAGLGGCGRGEPPEKILPYVRPPEELIPGVPLFFATAMPRHGYGLGLVVRSREGRPIKVEGNPQHPASLGATDAQAQAAVLSLYDPDRARGVLRGRHISTWGAFRSALARAVEPLVARRGAGLRILTETVTSPTLARQMRELLAALPEARWHAWEPSVPDASALGARLAFGRDVALRYDLRDADVLFTLDADLLASGPAAVRYARDWSARRARGPSRLYAVESTWTPTGSRADHRRPMRSSDIGPMLARLADAVQADRPLDDAWLEALRRDLLRARGASLVAAGPTQSAVVHAHALRLNGLLGNLGRTVVATERIEAQPADTLASLRALTADMHAGRVDLLLILGGNPAYTAPADLDFAGALGRVPFSAALGAHVDETARLCGWHVAETHFLETWSDLRAFDGTATILQPLIAPLYAGRSAHEVLDALAGAAPAGDLDRVRRTWADRDEAAWRKSLHDGLVPGTGLAPVDVAVRPDLPAPPAPVNGFELVLRPDPAIEDGRHANNAWLQELPRPLTQLTWDNALLLSPADAERLKLAREQVVEIAVGSRTVRAPVWILPGQAAGSGTLHLGYGRTAGGRVAEGVGVNAYALRSADALHVAEARLAPKDRRVALACTQDHWIMAGRDPARAADIEAFRADPGVFRGPHPAGPSLFPAIERKAEHAWAMTIDLDACLGCGACVVACQAENNVPTVGKAGVLNGREMHWLRIDRYFEGSAAEPRAHLQPMLCQHCETAPCEVVCPTNATVHSPEGLNEMVYNRCVGTRYCSNNCPYKVRRFNFFQYAQWNEPALALRRNPEVSVRERGVMEKCTFCVQRIEKTRIEARREGRRIGGDEIETACQQACPTSAIVFGDLRDPASRVSTLKAQPRNYEVLAELNTRPRTSYLGRLVDPNPEIKG
ncbi:MAG TPA: TAT-variant-translocated molybdopterin oxidoreductase [Planctomycetota bacterium]|nr:TAT-variant-translocated molybdopterin oxidoreductase [Planctomycetota bacterium]